MKVVEIAWPIARVLLIYLRVISGRSLLVVAIVEYFPHKTQRWFGLDERLQ